MDNIYIKSNKECHIINNHSQLTGNGYKLVIYPNGNKYYLLDGQYHRENAPAIIFMNGYQAWYIHDKLHRLDGPARIYSDGMVSHFINGKYYEENEYRKELTKCYFCKYQSKDKADLLVHYDYEEEKGNLICHQLREYLAQIKER